MDNKDKPQTIWKKIFLKTWHPQPTVFSTIILFLVLLAIFFVFGIVLILVNSSIVEATIRYDDKCTTIDQSCNLVNFIVDDDMEPPIYVYYELHNFYQNHRRYIKSQSSDQLSGDIIDSASLCDPVETNAQMGKKTSVSGTTLNDNDIAYPCGLIAKSFFNGLMAQIILNLDTFKFGTYEINENNIAWENDIGNKYKRASNYPNAYWIDVENGFFLQFLNNNIEHFAVWMRTAGLSDFRKLWGKIEQKIPKGTYSLTIQNNYDVSIFDGQKHFVLSTCGPFGGKNTFLAVGYLVVGGICLIIAIIFFVKKRISMNFGERKGM